MRLVIVMLRFLENEIEVFPGYAKRGHTKFGCLFCQNSFTLPAGELYDDNSVAEYDRLVCMSQKKIVEENNFCNQHTELS